MANVKVRTVGAIINRQPIGSTLVLEASEAEKYEKLGYVEVIGPEEKADDKPAATTKDAGESKPKPKRKKTKDD